MTTDATTIRNDSRYWTPLLSAVAIVVMFAPPIAIGFYETGLRPLPIVGTLIFAASAAWFFRSASRAPVELTIDGDALVVGRPRKREDRFEASRIKRWTFSIPDGPPTKEPPASNALLVVAFGEGTTFRGEVTADEAQIFASWFDRHLSHGA